jgi:nitrogen fixation NifU-like protein
MAEGHNPLCGDRVKIYLKVDAEDRIADVSFEGKGCAISVASASLMTEMLKGRRIAEAERLMGGFLHLVKGEDAGALDSDDRERLEVMAGVSAFPMRVKCATLAWHAMKAALEGDAQAKTE